MNFRFFIFIYLDYMKITSWLDFWTTNSTIWYNNWVNSKLVNLSDWKQETRTVLLADTEEMEFIIGNEAIKRYISWSVGRLLQSPKSFLNSKEEVKTILIWKQYSLTEIISIILKDFKEKLELISWNEIENVLLWRPVNFHDDNKNLDLLAQKRLENAAKLAWFKNIEFQLEPLAAAKTYQSTFEKWQEETVIIADLWWWTSDFSLLNITYNSMEVIWNNWIYIGWNNFDRRLSYDYFCNFLWKWTYQKSIWKELELPTTFFHTLSDWKKIHELWDKKNRLNILELYSQAIDKVKFWRIAEISSNPLLWYEYFEKVEKTKKELSKNEDYNWKFDMFKIPFDFEISRLLFEELIKEEIYKIIKTINELLIQTWLKSENIDKIFLTGWTSFLPIIQREVEKLLWKWKIIDNERFSSIWYWLTLESYERFR